MSRFGYIPYYLNISHPEIRKAFEKSRFKVPYGPPSDADRIQFEIEFMADKLKNGISNEQPIGYFRERNDVYISSLFIYSQQYGQPNTFESMRVFEIWLMHRIVNKIDSISA